MHFCPTDPAYNDSFAVWRTVEFPNLPPTGFRRGNLGKADYRRRPDWYASNCANEVIRLK